MKYFLIITFCSLLGSCINNVNTKIKFDYPELTIQAKDTILEIRYQDETLKAVKYDLLNSSPEVAEAWINRDGNVVFRKKKLGRTTIILKSTEASYQASCTINTKKLDSLKRWVAFGNSITKHGIYNFWWGEWGMAATEQKKDYVHVLNDMFEKHFGNKISFEAVNIALWEDNFKTFDKTILNKHLTGEEDLIIIRLGENVRNLTDYKDELASLVVYLKNITPKANFVITGNFWTNKQKDIIQKEIADKYNCVWLSLDHLDNSDNKSTVDTQVFGSDSLWHPISEGGITAPTVAAHPGDDGMYSIASCIFKALK